MKKNKTKLVFDCKVGRCPNGSDPNYDCGSICDRCKLCTQDGMVITKVRHKVDNVICDVSYVCGDEFIFSSKKPSKCYSIAANTRKFDEIFDVVETEYDDRNENFW